MALLGDGDALLKDKLLVRDLLLAGDDCRDEAKFAEGDTLLEGAGLKYELLLDLCF